MMMPKRSMMKKKKGPSAATKSNKSPELTEFIAKRDYAGAVALLDFKRQAGDDSDETLKWLSYACVHSGDFRKALETYETLENESSDPSEELPLWKACCHFYLGEYTEAEACAKEGPNCSLQNRILMHTAHKQNNESALMQ
jgi:intraflagellar transport protein 56